MLDVLEGVYRNKELAEVGDLFKDKVDHYLSFRSDGTKKLYQCQAFDATIRMVGDSNETSGFGDAFKVVLIEIDADANGF